MPQTAPFNSNILASVSGGGAPAPVATPPNPNPTPTPSGGGYTLPFGLGSWPPGGGGTSSGGPSTAGASPPPSLYDPNSGLPPTVGQYIYQTGPDGRVAQYTYTGERSLSLGIPGGWQQTDKYFADSGGAGSDPAYLAETVRSNMAREAEQRRRRALDAASNAASAFLTGTQLSDVRRLSAFQESRSLLPFLVDPEQEFVSGQEPGGLVEQSLRRLGVSGFQPSRVQHKQLTPAQLAIPPSGEQVGSEIVESIGDIQGAGVA